MCRPSPCEPRAEAPLRTIRWRRYQSRQSHNGPGCKTRVTCNRGFTLLEVMIALLVITLGIGAVINTTSESGWKSAQMKQRTIAGWVAQNQIAAYRARRTWSNKLDHTGEVKMANADWIWKMKVSPTGDPSLRKLDVDVFLKGEDGIKASFSGYIARI